MRGAGGLNLFREGFIQNQDETNPALKKKLYFSLDLFLWLYLNTKMGRRIVTPCY